MDTNLDYRPIAELSAPGRGRRPRHLGRQSRWSRAPEALFRAAKEGFYRHLRLKGYALRSFERMETGLNHFEAYLKNRGKDLADRRALGTGSGSETPTSGAAEPLIQGAGGADPRGVTPDDLDDYQKYLEEEKPRRSETVKTYFITLKSFFHFLYEEGFLFMDPMERFPLNLKRSPQRLPEVLTAKEIRKILTPSFFNRFSLGPRDRAILELFYSSGLRVSEMVRLKKEEVDLAGGLVTVRQGKGGKDRLVPLGSMAGEAILAYLRDCRQRLERPRLAPGLETRDRPELFLSRRGRRMGRSTLDGLVKKYAKLSGVAKKVYPHLFRHTLASHLLERGVCLSIVQGILGHARMETTQIYTHVRPVHLKKWYNRCHPQAKRLNEVLWKSSLS